MNREEWFQKAYELLGPICSGTGLSIPVHVHVSVGFPSRKPLTGTLGECWHSLSSQDGIPHVFISPLIDDGARALDVFVHEIIHASGVKGHGKTFKKHAEQIGLTGDMKATHATDELRELLENVVKRIGNYPHSKIIHQQKEKKQTTRMLKALCVDCGAIIRITKKVVENPGLPTCACSGAFILDSADIE